MRALRDSVLDAVSGRLFYGWAVLGVGVVGLFASGPGQSHTFSVFIGPISADLGLSRTEVASAYGFATLAAALGLPHMGRLTDRHGPRRMLLIVSILLGVACIAFGGMLGLWMLGLGFAALRFLGQGSLMLNCANLVSRWFERQRGFALSLMALGFSVSMAVHPPVAQWLIETVGWRMAWLWLGLATWLLMLPPVLLLVRDRPEDVGLQPDGGRSHGEAAPALGEPVPVLGLTRREALRTSTFYIICAGLFSLSMLVTALHFFQVSIFGAHGVEPGVAARVFPVSAITMVVTMPLVGRMLDRFPTRWVFAAAQLVMIASLVAASQVSDLPSAIGYAVVFGLNNAMTMTLFTYMWPRFFGLAHLGSIQGVGQMVGVVGASLGPLPLGVAFDRFGSYDSVLLALTALPLLCAGLALALRRPPQLLERS